MKKKIEKKVKGNVQIGPKNIVTQKDGNGGKYKENEWVDRVVKCGV